MPVHHATWQSIHLNKMTIPLISVVVLLLWPHPGPHPGGSAMSKKIANVIHKILTFTQIDSGEDSKQKNYLALLVYI